ncbi:MAG: hypothetical protein V2B18_15805 [Pseudomonadota bacterium]
MTSGSIKVITVLSLALAAAWSPAHATDFGLAENSLDGLRSIQYENVYTRVPTTGKLVSIKITDNGRIYYICREESGIAIYHLEVRPTREVAEKIEQDFKELSRKWDKLYNDELLLTRDRHKLELRKRLRKYSDAVWVRNEIVVGYPKGGAGQKGRASVEGNAQAGSPRPHVDR